jgi:Xaa-Pro aminopeptidase
MNVWPVVPPEEFEARMANFKKNMAKNRVDLVAVYSNMLDPSAVRYFSDFSGINESAAMVIPLEGDPLLCSGQACHEWSRFKSKVKEIRIMPEVGEVSGVEYDIEGQMDFEDLFRELDGKYKVRKIGIIGEYIFPQVIYGKIRKVFPEAEIVNAEMLMYELRMSKSENELNCIRKACEIISETFEFTVDRIRPGVTELDIQADLEAQMLRLGAESFCMSFAPMVPTGPVNSHLCMNRNSRRPVKESEIIDLAAGACYEGYNGVICTPVVLGKVPDEIGKAVNTAYEAMNLVVSHMKPGATSLELYKVYTDFLTKTGYRQYSPYGSVHSLGMLECETPFFSAVKETVMVENMVVAIDTYFKGMEWGSFRIEDTFVIRKGGAELLTTFNKKYITTVFK